MKVYFAKAFSLQLYKSKVKIPEDEKNLPNPELRYFINHSEISFVSTSLDEIRKNIKTDACDWIEGLYYTHALIFAVEEGYCPETEIIEFYDVDDLDAPSKNWRVATENESCEFKYIYKDMEGSEIALEEYFTLDGSWKSSKENFELVSDENREDEIIFVDPKTGKEIGGFRTFLN